MQLWSPSSRRAGIEIAHRKYLLKAEAVALLAEGGDRNLNDFISRQVADVALLAEGGDRNKEVTHFEPDPWVALLAEGGDRNPPASGRKAG